MYFLCTLYNIKVQSRHETDIQSKYVMEVSIETSMSVYKPKYHNVIIVAVPNQKIKRTFMH